MNKYVEKYAVFTKTAFNAIAELSISNRIIERESKLKVLYIVRQWVNERLPEYDYCVYFKGNCEEATVLDITMNSLTSDAPYTLNIFKTTSNIRVQIGMYETAYEIKRVYEKN